MVRGQREHEQVGEEEKKKRNINNKDICVLKSLPGK